MRIEGIFEKEGLEGASLKAYENIIGTRGRIVGPFGALLHSPELASLVGDTGAYIRFNSSIPNELGEIAVLTTASTLNCNFEWQAHSELAKNAGVPEGIINAIYTNTNLEVLSSDQKLIYQYAKELLKENRVSSNIYDQATKRFTVKELVDLTTTIGYYSMLASVLNAFEV
jgi:4-carboxymuconolactone decarboxylase